jgi:hypothetical protein
MDRSFVAGSMSAMSLLPILPPRNNGQYWNRSEQEEARKAVLISPRYGDGQQICSSSVFNRNKINRKWYNDIDGRRYYYGRP